MIVHILKLKEDLANATTEEEKAEIRAKIRGEERLKREAEEARYAESRLGRLTKTTGKINDIYRGIQDIVAAVQKLNNPWADADAAASKYAKTVGLVQKGMEALRKQTIENVARGRIGINYNTSAQELLELQSNYAKAAGRNIRLSNEDQENLAAVNFATQGLGTELLPEFEKMGVFLSDASNHIGKMYAQASKEGISLERYAKNVQQGLAMAQTYNFLETIEKPAWHQLPLSQISSTGVMGVITLFRRFACFIDHFLLRFGWHDRIFSCTESWYIFVFLQLLSLSWSFLRANVQM